MSGGRATRPAPDGHLGPDPPQRGLEAARQVRGGRGAKPSLQICKPAAWQPPALSRTHGAPVAPLQATRLQGRPLGNRLNNRPSLKNIRELLRMRSADTIELEFEPWSFQPGALAPGSASSSSPSSALSSVDGVSGESIGERMQRQYEAARASGRTPTAVEQRMERRKAALELSNQRDDRPLLLGLMLAFVLPPLIILLVSCRAGLAVNGAMRPWRPPRLRRASPALLCTGPFQAFNRCRRPLSSTVCCAAGGPGLRLPGRLVPQHVAALTFLLLECRLLSPTAGLCMLEHPCCGGVVPYMSGRGCRRAKNQRRQCTT